MKCLEQLQLLTGCCLLLTLESASGQGTLSLTDDDTLSTYPLSSQNVVGLSVDYDKIPSTDFYIPQCHSLIHNFTLIKAESLGFSVSETSSSQGDVIPGNKPTDLSLRNNQSTDMMLYCAFEKYSQTAPKPGGCNMEFNFENDPNIHTWFDGFQLWVQFQYASVNGVSCDNTKHWDRLKYSVYVTQFAHDVSDNYGNSVDTFQSILKNQMKVSKLEDVGTQIMQHTRAVQGKPAMLITAYPDYAVWVNIIVTDTVTGAKAAYVPTLSYGCQFSNKHPCKEAWYYYVMSVILCAMSLLLLFTGHRYFKTEMFIQGFMFSLFIVVMLLSIGKASSTAVVFGSLAIAAVCGGLWLILWWAAGIITLSLLLPAANSGYLLSSVIFYTPLVNVSWVKNDWETWIIYAAVMLLIFVFTILFSKKLNIICCTFLGSYGVMCMISVCIHGSLHHIVVEPIRRASVEKYYTAVFSAPFTSRDWVLVSVWVILWIVGCVVQFYTERGKADFPKSPRELRKERHVYAGEEEHQRLVPAAEREGDLRPRLLSYGAVDNEPNNPPNSDT